jgi:chorismate synthase
VELSYVTSGESHGPGITAVVSGLPAGLALDREAIRSDLGRRQAGYGRSPRQRIEQDDVEILGGVRHGLTLGGPLALIVRNRDHANWGAAMSAWPVSEQELAEVAARRSRKVQLPRPGHADLSGVMKYELDDVRNVLERASARETSARVAVGAIAKGLLGSLGIGVYGRVLAVGDVAAAPGEGAVADFLRARESEIGCSDPEAGKRMLAAIDAAAADRDTLGGIVEIRAFGCPPGLGSHTEPRLRLDARLAAAAVGIQAMKGVEIGDGFANALLRGSAVHDELLHDEARGYWRETNRAGGIEGGMSNGEPIVLRIAMKPLPTLMRPLRSARLDTHEAAEALVERSDTTAIAAAAVVGEAVVAFELARCVREKFGGDSTGDLLAAYAHYLGRIPWHPR